MNKPLSIDELKSLEVGDWVWISRLNNKRASGYVTDTNFTAKMFTCRSVNRVATTARIADYGKTWFAYKNKEQAESKGEIVELIAPLDSELWEIECPKYKDDKGNIWTSLTYKDAKVVKSKYQLFLSNYGMLLKGHYFLTEKEAEARLKELRGEK